MDAALLKGRAKGILHTGAWHGRGSGGHATTATAWSGKEPHRMAVCFPGLAEQRQCRRGQRHIAVLGAFAAAHMDEHPCTVNIGHPPVGALLEAQTTGVNGRQTDLISRQLQVR
jgi:hypothetical protein